MNNLEKIKILEQFLNKTMELIAKEDKEGIELDRVKEFMDFRTSLLKESDRGSVLMAAAFIEDKLGQLIASFLVDNKKVRERFLKGNGALNTFSSKIDMSFLLGLIPENILNDLHILRKIRNEFAHNASTITFDTPSIKDRTRALSVLSKVILRDNTRAYFLRSMTTILTAINMKMENFERCSSEENFDLTKLEAGLSVIEKSITPQESDSD